LIREKVKCSTTASVPSEVEYFIRPVINLKATNSYNSSVEIDMNEEQD